MALALRLLFFRAMPDPASPLKLRPALRRPIRRREMAVCATVLCASATGGAAAALLQPRAEVPALLTLPVPTAIAMPVPATAARAQVVAAAPAHQLLDLAPVVTDGGLRLVIATEVKPEWLGESIAVSDHHGVRVVVRPLSRHGEERFAGRVGSRVRLYGQSARLCTAEVTGLVALGRFAPEDFEAGDPPADRSAAWSAAEGSHMVAADLTPVDGDCAGALWAQPEGLAEAVRATIADASADQTRRASELLATSSEYVEMAGSGELHATFEAKIIATESEKLVVASALGEGCVGPEPFVTAVYALQSDGSLLPVGGHLNMTSIEAAADLDGDGHVEILFRSDDADLAILRRRTGAYQVEMHAAVPIYGCRC